ncbi:hypothetical protein ACFSQ7_14995 [Paenibacillus rhizoplanae]
MAPEAAPPTPTDSTSSSPSPGSAPSVKSPAPAAVFTDGKLPFSHPRIRLEC